MELNSSEAAARLGVKRSTLYAYVSRGWLSRSVAPDGRTSVFDSEEIDTFRSGRRHAIEGQLETVVSTGLTRVGDGELKIRGRDLVDMIADGYGYEDIVDWLWGGAGEPWDLPDDVARAVATVQAAMPAQSALVARVRATAVVVGAVDELRADRTPAGVRTAGRVLLRAMVAGLPVVGSMDRRGTMAAALWPRLTSMRASEERIATLDIALALLADHGIATSTFAARIAASVRADPYSIAIAGLGAAGGPMHGAAARDVHRLLETANGSGPAAAVGAMQRDLGHVPGFGHKAYRTEDPRYTCLMKQVEATGRTDSRLDTVGAVRDIVARRTGAIPNADLALGGMTWLAGMPPDAGEIVFVIARTAGWIAHGLEEYGEPPLRFRPRARYTGRRSS
jgi:citrate synthase